MTEINYPYDRDDFDPGLVALLQRLRRRPLPEQESGADGADAEDEEEANPLMLLREDMPAPVSALIHTIGHHGIYEDFGLSSGGYELSEIETLHYHSDAEDIVQALQPHEVPSTNTLLLGSTGGGEVNLLLTWKAGSYSLFRWDLEEAVLTEDGPFTSFFTSLRDEVAERCADQEDEFPEDLKAVLEAMGAWTQ